MSVDHAVINQTMGKMAHYLNNHECIVVSVSGGSDSDIIVHIIATHFRDFLPKIHFVFVNTGLEYQATKDHLNYLEDKYDITIDRVRGMSVVTAVRKYGVPVQSKVFSKRVNAYCRDVPYALKWIQVPMSRKTRFSAPTPKEVALAKAIKKRGISVSEKCCKYSKKNPAVKYLKSVNADLNITGERRSEGGIRSLVHKSCFEPANNDHIDKYMPLFFWNDETKQYYKESEEIRYSDCYEVWGFKRTGCVGCPFNSRTAADLKAVKKYEPKMYKACVNVFGESYRLSDEFGMRKQKIFDDTKSQTDAE